MRTDSVNAEKLSRFYWIISGNFLNRSCRKELLSCQSRARMIILHLDVVERRIVSGWKVAELRKLLKHRKSFNFHRLSSCGFICCSESFVLTFLKQTHKGLKMHNCHSFLIDRSSRVDVCRGCLYASCRVYILKLLLCCDVKRGSIKCETERETDERIMRSC